jgi:hypothetical protein
MLVAQIDEPGTIYYVIDEGGSQTPTPAQVMAGTDAHGSASKLIAKGSISAHTVINPVLRYEPYNITITGRGLHSFTFQLNLSRFGHTSPCPPV